MLRYIIKRLFISLLTLFVIAAATFFIMNLVPGSPFTGEKELPSDMQNILNEKYGLDKPLPLQFLKYMTNLFKGDAGISMKTGRNVSDTLLSGFKISCIIGILAVMIAVFTGITIGCISSFYANKVLDKIITFINTVIISMPGFLTAMLLLYFFCIKNKFFSVWEANNINYILPAICLSIYPGAYISRLTRAGLVEIMDLDYIKTVRAKGGSRLYCIIVHGLRNVLIPIISYLGPLCANVLTGSLVVESIFSTGGMGTLFLSSVTTRDYPLIMGITIFFALLIVFINFACDIICKFLDPRIKLS